ncbi:MULTISPECIES: glycosyltransferase family 1 protein [unclassified Burkholderia]|uniref:glycosyltransferase family 4 protein n=3 Tax=Burkholderia TaxID=32008 RepID=UPI0019160B24|nr:MULTISPECIES: glycosyltransferase family 1 protein [unclassified Burkholderia]
MDQFKAAALQFTAIWLSARRAPAARNAARALNPAHRAPTGRHQLLVDVSIIAVHDAGTGIQRVVRSLLLQLLASPPAGFDVRPVWATRAKPFHYADHLLGHAPHDTRPNGAPVHVANGDVFLGLDLTSRILPRRQRDLLAWRRQGVRCAFIVYDLLPLQNRSWFTPRAHRSFRHWLSTIAVHADELWCISRTVASEVDLLMQQRFGLARAEIPVRWFELGADKLDRAHVGESVSVPGYTRFARPILLMVGTIEPRKAHAQVLDAFDLLWGNGEQPTLVIVGKKGWRVDALAERLALHPQNGRLLFWLNEADDAQLEMLYNLADGLILASEAEGFGLPIIEAARHDKPLFLRDLSVFREVAGEHATYFSASDRHAMASQMSEWLAQLATGTAPRSGSIKPISWAASARQLAMFVTELATK